MSDTDSPNERLIKYGATLFDIDSVVNYARDLSPQEAIVAIRFLLDRAHKPIRTWFGSIE